MDPTEPLPRISECAVHLQMLEVFFEFKKRCTTSKALARSLNPRQLHTLGVTRKQRLRAEKYARTAWDTYLALAVVRFWKWWESLPTTSEQTTEKCTPLEITRKTLPPLDVLMVWHTYLLSPARYRSLCSELHHGMFNMEFPWRAVHEAINSYDNSYNLSSEAEEDFHRKTGLAADLFAFVANPKAHDPLTRVFLRKLAASQLPDASHFNVRDLDAMPQEYSQLMDEYQTWQHSISDLQSAVKRQEAFWEKMNRYGWIHSPCAEYTLGKSIARYHHFLKLFKLHPDTILVPTLHIDISWHTHQCCPARYDAATKEISGRFINHDDTIEEEALGDSFGETKEIYKDEFGEEYDVCLCWWCEALLAEKEEAAGDEDVDEEALSERAQDKVENAIAADTARRKRKLVRV